ncbi:carboxymuconolactone decarboxylase family protein [Epidermidibacterium keratini]|uniref:carboxymuconolactone decarboxylase family protein n=1 Tax=Epidermidibacterium keratini TaxID=1891644 RepID=UPI0018658D18
MTPRLDSFASPVLSKVVRRLVSANADVHDVLPGAVQELVKIRASQLNGCGFCLDMHTKDAAVAGETSVRLNLVAAWREATVFTDAERAALELAEFGTRLSENVGVPSDVWQRAAEHYTEEELAALVGLIATINAFNRVNVMLSQPAGSYEPGQFG